MPPSYEDVLLPLALLALGKSSPAEPVATPPTGGTSALEVPRVNTGGTDPSAWAKSRYEMLLGLIRSSGYVPDELRTREIALSLLAQWAHETARGKSEWNHNLGGWQARKGDTFFTARDMQTPGKPLFRWTAYPTLQSGMTDQVMRLVKTYPQAARLLLEEPKSSRWVEQLGRSGYYTAAPAGYARAWAMHRAELQRVVQ